MIKGTLKKYIVECIKRLINEQRLQSSSLDLVSNMNISRSKDARFGDFATNLAMLMAKAEQKNPRELAELIALELAKDTSIVTKADVAGPGFINISLSDTCLSSIIPTIAQEGQNYGKSKPQQAQSVLVEFVSVNQIDYRGSLSLPLGSYTKLKANYSFADEAGPSFEQRWDGAMSENFHLSQQVPNSSLIWSNCGGDTNISAKLGMMLRSNAENAISSSSLSGNEDKSGIVFNLQWRRCR